MTKDEALQLALKAMEVEQTVYLRTKLPVPEYLIKAIAAIKEALEIKDEYEQGFIDGMQKQMQSSVDKAVNAIGKREWVGLTDEEIKDIIGPWGDTPIKGYTRQLFDKIEAKLKEKNT
jgi:hypothetical protein